MPIKAPVGFIHVRDIKGPTIDQVVFEILICSRPLKTVPQQNKFDNHFDTTTFNRKTLFTLDQGYYYDFIQPIHAILAKKNTNFTALTQCQAWLEQYGLSHAPLRFELGMIVLKRRLIQSKIFQATHALDCRNAIDFYWHHVYPHFFIAAKLTQLAREQFSRQSDCLEKIILRQYVSFAQTFLRTHFGSRFTLGQEPDSARFDREKQWHLVLIDLKNHDARPPPVTWIKASVNRRWREASFFDCQEADLHALDVFMRILDQHFLESSNIIMQAKETPTDTPVDQRLSANVIRR